MAMDKSTPIYSFLRHTPNGIRKITWYRQPDGTKQGDNQPHPEPTHEELQGLAASPNGEWICPRKP